jgi:hypothetical protein
VKITVSFDAEVPDIATDGDIQEWLEFELGAACQMKESPLSTVDLEAERGSVTWRGRA